MNDIELLLRRWLPRPEMDPGFRDEVAHMIVSGEFDVDRFPAEVTSRRRRYYIGGAVVGAALAVGAATFGWLRFRREAA